MGFSRGKRTLHPDRQLEIRLHGHSTFLADRLNITDAVIELRDMSDGREDLIGRALGGMIGGYVGSPGMTNPYQLLGAALLAQLRYDTDEFKAAFEEARANASRPSHKNP